jgi:hypothetical protein
MVEKQPVIPAPRPKPTEDELQFTPHELQLFKTLNDAQIHAYIARKKRNY